VLLKEYSDDEIVSAVAELSRSYQDAAEAKAAYMKQLEQEAAKLKDGI
jgi:hypothetical protein